MSTQTDKGRDRMTRYRQRRKAGVVAMPHVQITDQVVQRLTEAGHLKPDQAEDRDAIALAAKTALETAINLRPPQSG